jgi:hypothetical protein
MDHPCMTKEFTKLDRLLLDNWRQNILLMTFDQTIKNWNEKLKPYHSLIGMLIFFVVSLIAVYKFIVRPADLSVVIDKREVNFPNTINDRVKNAYQFVSDSIHSAAVKNDVASVYNYLVNTNSFWALTLKNESDHTIKSIRLRVSNVNAINSFGVSSPYLLTEETNALLKRLSFQEGSGIIYLDKIEELPRNASITIYLWGKMPSLTLDENVFVTYEGGEGRLAKETVVTGFKAYLVDYIYEILVMMLLIFILVYRQVVKRKEDVAS